MSVTDPDPLLSVTVAIQGIAVCCHNKAFNRGRGRWEIAFPRYEDHILNVEIEGMGFFLIDPSVKVIEIRDVNSVAQKNAAREGGGVLDRKDPTSMTSDFRWVTDFSNELPHNIVSVVTKEQDENRVDVTMMYLYDAVAYTISIDPFKVIRLAQDQTAPLVDGRPSILPEEEVLPILEQTEDFIFEADTIGLDIESSERNGIEIFVDRAQIAIPHADAPLQINISNLERQGARTRNRIIESKKVDYGLGDLYRYYELFNVDGEKVHEWGQSPPGSGSDIDCVCNMVRVRLANLEAFL